MTNVAGSLAKAQSLTELGRYVQARAEIVRYLATEPNSATGWCVLALCELRLGYATKAQQAAGRALTENPESDWALRLRALALAEQSMLDAALDSATAAVRAE